MAILAISRRPWPQAGATSTVSARRQRRPPPKPSSARRASPAACASPAAPLQRPRPPPRQRHARQHEHPHEHVHSLREPRSGLRKDARANPRPRRQRHLARRRDVPSPAPEHGPPAADRPGRLQLFTRAVRHHEEDGLRQRPSVLLARSLRPAAPRPSLIPSLCTHSTRARIEWRRCHRAACMARSYQEHHRSVRAEL